MKKKDQTIADLKEELASRRKELDQVNTKRERERERERERTKG
jgi:hypothetical protein